MKDLRGKVAVVTGGASGIGRALADRFAENGMSIVLADIEERALAEAEQGMRKAGANVIGVRTDVSELASVEALAQRALEAFGAVHVVCNNAGIGGAVGPLWTHGLEEWHWTLGVNLFGVVHGIRVFLPILLNQDEGHVVNTASMYGLVSHPLVGIYGVSKHAVVTITETLSRDLALVGSRVKTSVLCPAYVQTNIHDYERNRPEDLGTPAARHPLAPTVDEIKHMISRGMPPAQAAEVVVKAIRAEQLYILTHPGFGEVKGVLKRFWSLGKGILWSRGVRSPRRTAKPR